jgi:5-(carboxyamino)imidazole ribonucleotide mutase
MRILAAKILGSSDEEISTKLEIYQLSLKESAFYHRRNKKTHPNSYD